MTIAGQARNVRMLQRRPTLFLLASLRNNVCESVASQMELKLFLVLILLLRETKVNFYQFIDFFFLAKKSERIFCNKRKVVQRCVHTYGVRITVSISYYTIICVSIRTL